MTLPRALAALLLMATPAGAAGLAELGPPAAEGYAEVRRETAITFPADHAAHPEFRTEWWYVTANLSDASGRDFGVQWTLFRSRVRPGEDGEGWQSPQVWMAHAAATGADFHRFAEKFARGGVGTAGVDAVEGFAAWIDDWSLAGPDARTLAMSAEGDGFSYDLRLSTERPFVLQGENGYSLKTADGQASHYYAQPFYEASGTIVIDGEPVEVVGVAWMDREWSSQILTEEQAGWDWFALHLTPEDKLMIGRMRNRDGSATILGNWARPDGSSELLSGEAIEIEPTGWSEIAGRRVPTEWRIALPERGVALAIEPLNAEAWVGASFPYWEGPIAFSGSHAGRGYLEMTGY